MPFLQWDVTTPSNTSEDTDEENEGRRAMNCWWTRMTTQKDSAQLSPRSGFPSVLALSDYLSDTESETGSNIDGHSMSPRCKDGEDTGNFLACCIRR